MSASVTWPVGRSGSGSTTEMDGAGTRAGRLPGGWLHRRRLVKCTATPTAVVPIPAVTGPVATVERRQDHVHVVLDVTRGWRPRGLPPLMAAVARVAPVFRNWPMTYRWSATITFGTRHC